MKKLFFFAGVTALFMSSCSNDIENIAELPNDAQKEIKISTYAAGLTRGADLVYGFERNDTIKVYAFSGESSIINAQYLYNGVDWSAYGVEAGTKFLWPTDPNQEVEFLGIYVGEAEYSTDLNQNGNWSIETDGTYDLMAANYKASYASSNLGAINLPFKHILSNVTVYAKGGVEGYNYRIDNVKIIAAKSAQYTFNDEAPFIYSMNDADEIYTKEYELTEAYEIAFNTENFTAIDNVMVLPSAGETNKAQIELTFIVQSQSNGEDEKTFTITGDLGILAPGSQYRVNCVLTPTPSEIVISASVAEWGEETIITIEK